MKDFLKIRSVTEILATRTLRGDEFLINPNTGSKDTAYNWACDVMSLLIEGSPDLEDYSESQWENKCVEDFKNLEISE